MAAGLGFKDFVTGEVLTAADVDGYLMQGVWVFASAAARDAAVTSPQEGNFAYLKDTNVTTYYTGSAWANLDTTGMTNPMTTTGDTIYSSSGSTPARLGIGSTGQVLTVASGLPSWSTPASGGGLTLLSTTTLSGTSTTISSISQDYTNLLILGITISANSGDNINFRLNGDSGANYANHTIYMSNTTVAGSYNTNDTSSQYIIGCGTGNAGLTAARFVMNIFRYTQTEYKVITYSGEKSNEFTTGGTAYNSTTAISSITFLHNGTFNAGTVYIYGVK